MEVLGENCLLAQTSDYEEDAYFCISLHSQPQHQKAEAHAHFDEPGKMKTSTGISFPEHTSVR